MLVTLKTAGQLVRRLSNLHETTVHCLRGQHQHHQNQQQSRELSLGYDSTILPKTKINEYFLHMSYQLPAIARNKASETTLRRWQMGTLCHWEDGKIVGWFDCRLRPLTTPNSTQIPHNKNVGRNSHKNCSALKPLQMKSWKEIWLIGKHELAFAFYLAFETKALQLHAPSNVGCWIREHFNRRSWFCLFLTSLMLLQLQPTRRRGRSAWNERNSWSTCS